MKRISSLALCLLTIIACKKYDTMVSYMPENNSGKAINIANYNLGLTYSFSPSIGNYTTASNNSTGTCVSIGGVIKATITALNGDIAYLKIVKSDGSKFMNPILAFVRNGSICSSEIATLIDQSNVVYSNSFSAGLYEINIPFKIIPGKYKTIYPSIISGGNKYHCNPISINANGWMNNGETQIQKNIISNANSLAGFSSGRSVTSSGMWSTDMAGGDGVRWRNAISVFHNWKVNNPTITPTTIKNTMKTYLAATYSTTDQTTIVNRIISVYKTPIPTDDNSTMVYMGVRKQCMEFVGSTSIKSGGVYKSYSSAAMASSEEWRPGMALYNPNVHAMIINKIEWINNAPTRNVVVCEANYGSGFNNPIGQIPWFRVVANTRTFMIPNTYKVVSLDR